MSKGAKKYTSEEIDFLRKHAHEMTAGELAEALGRTPGSIASACEYRGIQYNKQQKRSNRVTTICEACKWATGIGGVCPWARELSPVEGWTAEKVDLKCYETWRVIKCPLYEKG